MGKWMSQIDPSTPTGESSMPEETTETRVARLENALAGFIEEVRADHKELRAEIKDLIAGRIKNGNRITIHAKPS